jgi:very-short-patch-repair endonuclease
MPRRSDLPVTLAIAPFATREADEHGFSRERLRSSDIHHPHHGLNAAREPVGLLERCSALAELFRAGEAFSHTTAAALLGAPLPRSRHTMLHVTHRGENRMRRPGVVGHRAAHLPVTLHLGLPIVAPAHVFAQLGTLLGHDDLVAVGDFLVTPDRHAKSPALTDLAALDAAIARGARGAARARSALRDVRTGAESPMETRLRLLLMRSGLPEPLLNPAVRVGDRVLHPDILYPDWRVAIEYEGEQHRTDARQWRDDIRRAEWFADGGWRVMRVTKDDVLKEPEQLLARVCRVLAKRAPAG